MWPGDVLPVFVRNMFALSSELDMEKVFMSYRQANCRALNTMSGLEVSIPIHHHHLPPPPHKKKKKNTYKKKTVKNIQTLQVFNQMCKATYDYMDAQED
jgi:hypothetical protein